MSEFNEYDQHGPVPNRDAGSIISHAFEMYKGIFIYAIATMIVYFVGGFFIQMLTGFDSASFVEGIKSSGGKFNFRSIPGLQLYMGASSLFGLLLSPLYVGLIYMVNKYDSKNPIKFSDLFIGYRQNFMNILIYSLFSAIISYIAFALCVLPFIFVYPFILLGYPILLFENASATKALQKSFNIAKENYKTFLLTGLLGFLISASGAILCVIGIILTAPFMMIVMYSIYCAFLGKPRQIMYSK